MAKDMKTRKGKDNIYYPYTSPDLVIDSTGENQTVKNNNMKTEIQAIKDNQIILVDDDTSIEGISDTEHDTLTTQDKTLIGSINEVNAQCKDLASKKFDTVTFSDNNLAFLANNKTIKTIDLGTLGKDALVTTNISGTTLSLTKDKYQTTTIADGTEIVLPSVTSFTEIHLFFETTTDLTLILPACKWQNGYIPTILANKTYEFIFTYTTEWLGGVIAYE